MIELPEFDLHIFDLDDTLINTRAAYYSAQEEAVRKVLPELTGAPLLSALQDLKWLCRVFGSGNTESYFAAFIASQPNLNATDTSSAALLTTVYQDAFQLNLRPLDRVRHYLKTLQTSGKQLALVSNGTKASQLKKLHLTGFADFFPDKQCFISETYLPSQKKPSPHMIELACQSVDIDPGRSVFYGNSAEDILAGNLAGVTTVLIGKDNSVDDTLPEIGQPDFRLDNWLD